MPYEKTHGVVLTVVVGFIIGAAVNLLVLHYLNGSPWAEAFQIFFLGLFFQLEFGPDGWAWVGVYIGMAIGWVLAGKIFWRKVRYTNLGQCTSCGTKYTLANNSRCPACGSDVYQLY